MNDDCQVCEVSLESFKYYALKENRTQWWNSCYMVQQLWYFSQQIHIKLSGENG
jgi:hypothetical protein